LGVILYYIVTKKYPFQSTASPKVTMESLESYEISKDLKDLIVRLLNPDEYEEFKISTIVKHDWFETGYV